MSSHSEALGRRCLHRSKVKMVLELLKMEVREDMRAAIITAIIRPRRPNTHTQRLRVLDNKSFRLIIVCKKGGRERDIYI